MGKITNVLKSLEESSLSRRSFMKSAVALDAVAECSSSDDSSVISLGGGE